MSLAPGKSPGGTGGNAYSVNAPVFGFIFPKNIRLSSVYHSVGPGHVVLGDDDARGFTLRTWQRLQLVGPRCLAAAEVHRGEVLGQFLLRDPERFTAPHRVLLGCGNLLGWADLPAPSIVPA